MTVNPIHNIQFIAEMENSFHFLKFVVRIKKKMVNCMRWKSREPELELQQKDHNPGTTTRHRKYTHTINNTE